MGSRRRGGTIGWLPTTRRDNWAARVVAAETWAALDGSQRRDKASIPREDNRLLLFATPWQIMDCSRCHGETMGSSRHRGSQWALRTPRWNDGQLITPRETMDCFRHCQWTAPDAAARQGQFLTPRRENGQLQKPWRDNGQLLTPRQDKDRS